MRASAPTDGLAAARLAITGSEIVWCSASKPISKARISRVRRRRCRFATTADTSLDWFGTVRGRVGYTVGAALLYGTGGFVAGGVQDKLTVGVGAPAKHDATATGYAAGGWGGIRPSIPLGLARSNISTSISGSDRFDRSRLRSDRDVRSRVQHGSSRVELPHSRRLRASQVGFVPAPERRLRAPFLLVGAWETLRSPSWRVFCLARQVKEDLRFPLVLGHCESDPSCPPTLRARPLSK